MIFRKNIILSDNISIKNNNGVFIFNGPMGTVSYKLHELLTLDINNSVLCLYVKDLKLRKRELILLPSIFNTTYVMLKNCLLGVVKLFEYFLIIKGVGYKASYDSKTSVLTLVLGYSHSVVLNVPSDIFIDTPSNSEIIVRSVSKSRAGQFASEIRYIKAPEIYKGNGIRYKNENIVLKIPKKTK